MDVIRACPITDSRGTTANKIVAIPSVPRGKDPRKLLSAHLAGQLNIVRRKLSGQSVGSRKSLAAHAWT
jgi:hypothetical protein